MRGQSKEGGACSFFRALWEESFLFMEEGLTGGSVPGADSCNLASDRGRARETNESPGRKDRMCPVSGSCGQGFG